MAKTERWKKELEDIVYTYGEKGGFIELVFDVCENERTAKEMISFIKDNNLVCKDTINNDEHYNNWLRIDEKCMLIARRENIGEFVDEEYAKYLDEILAKEKAEKKRHEKGDK